MYVCKKLPACAMNVISNLYSISVICIYAGCVLRHFLLVLVYTWNVAAAVAAVTTTSEMIINVWLACLYTSVCTPHVATGPRYCTRIIYTYIGTCKRASSADLCVRASVYVCCALLVFFACILLTLYIPCASFSAAHTHMFFWCLRKSFAPFSLLMPLELSMY